MRIVPARPGAAEGRLPADSVWPDYERGGLWGLADSLGRWLRGERRDLAWMGAHEAPLPADGVLVFWLIDGLGDLFLQRHGQGSVLMRHRQGCLTSVFPSTTASAITTVMTGLAPLSHGLTGWFIHDRRFGGVLAPLPLQTRDHRPLKGHFLLQRLFPYPNLFGRGRRPAIVLAPEQIAHSDFSRRHARGARILAHRGIDELAARTHQAVADLQRAGGGYVYAYHDRFDALSHAHGCGSAPVLEEFARVDRAYAHLLDGMPGQAVEVLLSADHGFIDNPPERRLMLAADSAAAVMLAAPLSGERRAALCTLRAGAEHDFAAWADEVLAGRAVLRRSEELVDAGLFGHGVAHPRLAERVGTHVLLMEPGWTIADVVPGERPHEMLGVHGGLSAAEMWVPLVRARPV